LESRAVGDKPLVSVVIATYNMASYLPLAVRSVLAQTYENIELLIIDDGSTDGTRKAVKPFLDDPRVKYRVQENKGQAAAKNHGIRESRGEFVAFCDADDMWTPEKLEWQLPHFDGAERVGVVYGRVAVIVDDSGEIRPDGPRECYSGRVTAQLFRNNFVPFGTAIVRRQCLEEMGVFDERYRMGIDWELWLRISTRYEFRFVDAVVYLYRIWPGQMSGNWRGRYEYCFRIMQDFLTSYSGILSKEAIAEAWADTYANRGRIRSYHGEHIQALMDIVHAINHLPTYWPTWRLIGRVLLNACGYRKL
jgi:glycosyltransferase involved in cell wall biosynthesis